MFFHAPGLRRSGAAILVGLAWFLMTDRLFVVAQKRSKQQIVGGRDFTRTS